MLFDNVYFCVLVVFGIFAFGDFLGVITKAKLSSVFVALMIFLVGFLLGIIPPDIIERANLTQVSKLATGFLVFNMGTSIDIRQMIREWKVLLMSLVTMAVAIVALLVMSPILGKEASLVSIPIVNGGIVATNIMTEAALEKGFNLAAALGAIVFAIQKFVGTIPASRSALSEARSLIEDYRLNGPDVSNLDEKEDILEVENFASKNKKYFTNYMTLGIAAFFIFIASILGKVTFLAMSIWCLILGITLRSFNLVPNKILDVGKSSGLWMTLTFTSIIPALAKINLSDLASLGIQTVLVFGSVLLFTYIFVYKLPLWKIVGSRNLAIGVAMSQLLGFPATFLIINEVATAVSETDDEKNYILNKLTPAYVISGFVSVTSISIIIAGIFASLL
ncbi:hypothetical protein [Neofamilia massiliensis]|uniref:hypothetical protein n=1 Tax=Neofamilia massiliensis TaxID=1673724 RepID=UPI0006BB7970|nr:hypothetical protein [Neofamilia massiliensis]